MQCTMTSIKETVFGDMMEGEEEREQLMLVSPVGKQQNSRLKHDRRQSLCLHSVMPQAPWFLNWYRLKSEKMGAKQMGWVGLGWMGGKGSGKEPRRSGGVGRQDGLGTGSDLSKIGTLKSYMASTITVGPSWQTKILWARQFPWDKTSECGVASAG